MPELSVEPGGRTGCPGFKCSKRLTLGGLNSLQLLRSLPSDSSLISSPTTPSPPSHTPSHSQPRWPPCCSLNIQSMLLPQGLCTDCLPQLRFSYPRFPHGSLSNLFQDFSQMPPSPRGFQTHHPIKVVPAPPPPRLSLPLPCVLFAPQHVTSRHTLH